MNMKDVFLTELDRWSFPTTDWELETVKEIERLRVITVRRVDAATLEWMRMKPRQCHTNARFYEEKDPERLSKRIIGWWPQGGNYLLHSIVRREGQHFCVTPVDPKMVPEAEFPFIPDPKIEARVEGDLMGYYRDGGKIGPGVRGNPAKTLAYNDAARKRLLSGMDPYEAMQVDPESLRGL